ncbi:MAG: B12-binding domain-containing radical SAM protein, partial [Anaerolineae bacterium]|nr:B12-binding domain-containing radical SAM protein [Anaerolineae bacterium]
EPEETAWELIDTLEVIRQRPDAPPGPFWWFREPDSLAQVRGIAYRRDGQVVVTADRPFIRDLDTLPIPRHELLPLERYKLPIVAGRYTFVVTSRGCPGGCRFCIKHVTYQNTFRFRSPEHILREVEKLVALGTTNIHFEADLFSINRDQVVGLCNALIERGNPIRWTCNSRVDFVDEELLHLMSRSGCWMIAWGIESGSREILRRVSKGIEPEQVMRALRWAKAAGIRNYGYFIIGLPGETEETIEQTIALSKALPLDFALFHIAVPYPGTPLWYEALEQGWLRVTRWEDFDMYNSAVLEYPQLSADQLQKAARRAAREWALRPGPIWTFIKELRNLDTLRQWMGIGARHLSWIVGRA